ncbi:MAG: hypothetical protein IJV76_13245, partial [Clostridia bacterium]|nr:hypothetical protein [Clostridia bacterium]
KQNLCLVVEYPEDCSMEKRLTECLGDCMIRYRLSEETAVPFLIVLSRDPSGMSPVLRRQLWQCRVQMPDETMRKRFWECTLEKGGESQDWHAWQLGYPEEKITAELLTELTEGMTYRGMRELYDCLCCAVQAQDQTAAENLLREEFRRVHPEINELEHMEKQLSEKEILFEKIGRLLDWIPEFASQLFEAVGENAERHSEILKNLPEHRKTTADADEYAYSETSQDVQVPAQNVQSEINDELRGVLKNTGNIANDMSELTSLYDAVDKKKIVEKHAKDTVGELLDF